MAEHVIGVDLAEVFDPQGEYMTTLAWGDRIEVLEEGPEKVRIELIQFETHPDGSQEPVKSEGYLARRGDAPVVVQRAQAQILKIDFVDVQQGDAAVIETPDGKVILVDGGDNQLFARYLAARYPGSSEDERRKIDCILVTHGDADHFAGLTQIRKSESHERVEKRLFISPERVYHNGLVKRPDKGSDGRARKEAEQLGATTPLDDDDLVITGLEEDLLTVPDEEMNEPFKAWKRALEHYSQHAQVTFRRLERGDAQAFAFLQDEDVEVKVLGPIATEVPGGGTGLRFLGTPTRRYGHPSKNETKFMGKSASHTINGHSIVFRLTYHDWSLLFAGDLNEESENTLADAHEEGDLSLRSEVFKVPHHGSADFLHRFLKAVEPVISVVSSGDEADKEYIHPRATLMSALGKYGRDAEPTVFVTEMVAFFKAEGFVLNNPQGKGEWAKRRDPFFAFSRAAYGIVRLRTDGKRLLVFTNSGQRRLKEAYAYTLEDGKAVPQELTKV